MPLGVLRCQGSRVPLLGYGGVCPIGAGHVLDSGAGAGAQDACAELGIVESVAGVAADRAGEVEHHEGRLALPTAAVPMHPGAPERDVAQMIAVAARELRRLARPR